MEEAREDSSTPPIREACLNIFSFRPFFYQLCLIFFTRDTKAALDRIIKIRHLIAAIAATVSVTPLDIRYFTTIFALLFVVPLSGFSSNQSQSKPSGVPLRTDVTLQTSRKTTRPFSLFLCWRTPPSNSPIPLTTTEPLLFPCPSVRTAEALLRSNTFHFRTKYFGDTAFSPSARHRNAFFKWEDGSKRMINLGKDQSEENFTNTNNGKR